MKPVAKRQMRRTALPAVLGLVAMRGQDHDDSEKPDRGGRGLVLAWAGPHDRTPYPAERSSVTRA